MQIETAVVKIDRSDNGGAAVSDERFGVDHAGGVFINLYACADERFIVRARQLVYHAAVDVYKRQAVR